MFKQAESMRRDRQDRAMRRAVESSEMGYKWRPWLGLRAMHKASTKDPECPIKRWGRHPDEAVREIAIAQGKEQHEAHGPCRRDRSGRGVRTKGWQNWREDAEAAWGAITR